MTRISFRALGIALLLSGASLGAQRPVSVVLGGGASLPTGALGDRVDAGWHALGALALASPMLPHGLRLDVAYDQFARTGATAAASTGRQTALSGTLNLTYRMPTPGTPVSPYVITGLGAYRFACAGGASCGTSTKFGWNAGLGLKLAALGLKPFVEARFHSAAAPGGARYFPVTLGLVF